MVQDDFMKTAKLYCPIKMYWHRLCFTCTSIKTFGDRVCYMLCNKGSPLVCTYTIHQGYLAYIDDVAQTHLWK